MSTELWLAYVTTVLILMSTPGPSHLLMLSNSLGNGFNRSLATAGGDLSANIVQMTVASLGLVSLIHSSQEFFDVFKWAGVSYLIFMGVMKFRKRFDPSVAVLSRIRTLRSLYWQGFMTSAANPKAVVFFAALFPQFVNPALQTGKQLVIMGVTYLVIDDCFLTIYGGFAGWIESRFRHQVGHHMNQISGALLVGAAILLGLKEIKTN
ncbi:MAG: LysE family translocator [Gammaproteobacteria bacterium]|nr:MAG: LysE family translocator [Gammaproteobacteria bacterium]